MFQLLSAREQLVLRHRFGIDGHERLTLEAVGRQIGLTKERVRQIEWGARRTLAGLMDDPLAAPCAHQTGAASPRLPAAA